jgi:hypothetical protein
MEEHPVTINDREAAAAAVARPRGALADPIIASLFATTSDPPPRSRHTFSDNAATVG